MDAGLLSFHREASRAHPPAIFIAGLGGQGAAKGRRAAGLTLQLADWKASNDGGARGMLPGALGVKGAATWGARPTPNLLRETHLVQTQLRLIPRVFVR